jgi:hypothetical protein
LVFHEDFVSVVDLMQEVGVINAEHLILK